MKSVMILRTIVICFLYFDYALCIIPLIPVAVGGISTAIGLGYLGLCRFKECCTDDYIPADLNSFRSSLKFEFHNQHLALETVYYAIKSHIENEKPSKALALSFQGSSGTGKNHMVNLIVDSVYLKGAASNYVHYYNGHLDFTSGEKLSDYQRQIKEDIINHLVSCQRSIFIFDDVDHMPEGILDALVPFLDYNPRLLSVNPTRAIFIFISNIGSRLIEKKLKEMWQAGIKREETKLQDFESLLAGSAFNEQGGFHKSDIIEFNFIDHHVPFLPFEEVHVKKCIVEILKKKDSAIEPSIEMIQEVMAHMKFEVQNIYSNSGCKRIDSKVSSFIERRKYVNTKKNAYTTGDSESTEVHQEINSDNSGRTKQ